MINSFLGKLWANSWSMVLAEIGAQQAQWLLSASFHPTRLTTRRAGTIVSRVRLVAGLFAILTPLWMVIDFLALPREVWQGFVPMRLLTAVSLGAVLMILRGMHTLRDAYRALFFLLAVPSAFFLFSYLHTLQADSDGVLRGFSVGYTYLPFIMVAGLSIFPLTVLECAGFTALLLLVQVVSFIPNMPGGNWAGFLGSFSMLLVLGGVSMMAGLSQLAFMVAIASEGIHDSLTGCYSRRCGEELLDLQYTWSTRGGTTLGVAILDLDRFQDLNLRFGYLVGDALLKNITEIIHDKLRAGDMLVRWTGNQFLLVLPNCTAEQAADAVQRLISTGIGVKPDGTPLTASIGVAERTRDATDHWWALVDRAAERAKTAAATKASETVER
jgi:diguanylate cyclase (GGDEF)-like protein